MSRKVKSLVVILPARISRSGVIGASLAAGLPGSGMVGCREWSMQELIDQMTVQGPILGTGKPKRFTFSLRSLLYAVFASAIFIGAVITVANKWREQSGYGPISNRAKWPKALRMLVEQNPDSAEHIRVYGMNVFIDQRSIWLIDGNSDLIDNIISRHSLETTDQTHPMGNQLLQSIPSDWKKPNITRSEWHATPGFGKIHLEGTDLFILLLDRKQKVGIVLHHWNF